MRNKIFLIFMLCLSALAFSKSVPVPEWVLDKNSVFPSETYISALGEGDSKDRAISEANAGMARYFKTEIQANTKASTHALSDGNNTTFEKKLDTQIEVSSSVTLSGLEYTTPFYDKKSKKWYCVAFLEREKSWIQFLPAIEKQKADFYAFFFQAEKESESVLKYALYKKAKISGENFLTALEYGRIINPKKEESFASDRKCVNKISCLIEEQKNTFTVFLEISGDYGNFIKSAVSDTLSQNGFNISKTENEANYRAEIIVENNESGENPIAILPSIDFKIIGKSGKTVLAQQVQAEKKSLGYRLESAQKKAYPVLAEKARNTISAGLKKIIGE